MRQEDASFNKHDFLTLNSINKSNRNLIIKSDIYADEEEDRSLKYYKLGKSAQNIFKDNYSSLKRELSPVKYRDSSFEKKKLN